MYRAFLLVVMCALQAGCASTEHLIENLQTVESDNYVIFQEDISYIQKRGAFSVNWTVWLSKGVYKPELENTYGTYYRGPPGCVSELMGEHPMRPTKVYDGGIWVPRDRINNTPRVYYYSSIDKEAALRVAGFIGAAIAIATEGDIVLLPSEEKGSFLDAVSITNLPLE